MTRTRPWRHAAWIGAFGLSTAAVVTAAPPEDAAERATAPPAAARPTSSTPRTGKAPRQVVHVELERMARKAEAKEAAKEPAAPEAAGEAKDAAAAKPEVVNAFASTSWYVPPPPPKPEPPPKPTAPPLPFSFMGRYEDPARSAVVVMLTRGDRLYTVSEGDVIDDTYRVERITDRTVELLYLPLKEKQSLQTGGA